MNITLQDLAVAVGGELIGDPALTISGAASLLEATPGEISFFADPRYKPLLHRTQATAVFVPADFTEESQPAQIRTANPRKAFEQIVVRLARPAIQFAPGIHPTAVVASDAKIGAGVSIQPYAVIEAEAVIGDHTVIGAHTYVGHGSVIGPGSLIYPHVTIRERTIIGARVVVHSGVVIGADGFGFEIKDGANQKIPQIGIVQIDDDVEIGANTTIDRARFGRTWIKQGVKIDNLVMIAHNVVIGRHAIIAAQVGIAGSARIGDNVMIGGQAGITGHIEIGDRVQISGKAGISKNVASDTGVWWGIPAVPMQEAHKQLAWIRRLGKLFARVKAIEQRAEIKNDPS